MRNAITAILPPQHQTTILLDPPIDPTKERLYVLTARGKAGIVVQEISPSEVLIQNLGERVIPTLVFVGSIGLGKIPGALANLVPLLKRKKTPWLKP